MHSQELLLDLVDLHVVDIFQGDAGYVLFLVRSFCLFLHILRHGGRRVPEGLVFRELGLVGRNQLIAVFDIVDIFYGEPSALFEEGAEDLPVYHLAGVLFIVRFQKLGLQRVVSPQGAVAAADKDILFSCLLCHLVYHSRDLMVRLCGLLRRKSSGVGEHVEQAVFLVKACPDAVLVPACVDRDIVDRLHAGGVVVQDYDLFVAGFDLRLQKAVNVSLVYLFIRSDHICTDGHMSFLL